MSPTIDELVAQAAPVADEDLDALALDELEAELLAQITRAPRERSRRARRGAPPRLRIAAALMAAACAALVLAGTSFLGADRATQRAWAAEAVRVANAVPRLLIAEAGWKVERADEFSVAFGEMSFARGERRYDLKWNRVRPGAVLGEARRNDPSARIAARTRVLGRDALIYRYGAGGASYLTAIWRQDGYELELRAGFGWDGPARPRELVALLHALRAASVDEWLSAMPASVVLPADRAQVVRAMLADIPLPAGFDAGRLAAGDAVRDRYQLGAHVAGAAACAWIGQWARARRAGDEAAAAAAARALRGSRDWAILREMQAEGDYPRVLWEHADAVAGSGTVSAGRKLTVQESYVNALGCDGGG